MLSAVLLGSIQSCLKKEKRGSLKLWKHFRTLVSFKQSVIELHINFFNTQKMKIFKYNYIVSCTVLAPIIYFKLSKYNELSSIVM